MIIEEKTQKSERKLLELLLHIQRLNHEYQQVLDDLKLKPEQIRKFIDDPTNFSPPIWQQLQEEKKRINDQLDLELNNVKDPDKSKKVFSERGNVQQHWLFVR